MHQTSFRDNEKQNMFNASSKIISLCLIAGLTACATMSESECRSANRDTWVSVGFEDASKGRPESAIRGHQKACAGISTPDLSAYREGHTRGVKQYCVANTGYQSGLRGQSKSVICPQSTYPQYHQAYAISKRIFHSEQNIEQLTRRLQDAAQAHADAEHQVKVLEAEIVSPGLSMSQRKQILVQLTQLREDLPRYAHPVAQLEHKLGDAIRIHNRTLLQNAYEIRSPLSMPVIDVELKPEPQPHAHPAKAN